MTRNGRKDRNTAVAYNVGVDGYNSLFASIFCTSADVDGIKADSDGLNSTYILKILYNRGKIAYDKGTGLWLPFSGVGKANAYGVPSRVRLWGADGTQIERGRENVYLFKANPLAFPWAVLMAQKSAFMANCDNAINQNLDAVKQMTCITAENELLGNILTAANKERQDGKSVCIIDPYAYGGDNEAAAASTALQGIKIFSTHADYLIDRFKEAKAQEYDEALHLLGVQTGYEKGERMTDDEIAAFNGEATACLSVLEQTFNTDAEAQGAPFRIVPHGKTNKRENETGKNKKDGENIEDGEKALFGAF